MKPVISRSFIRAIDPSIAGHSRPSTRERSAKGRSRRRTHAAISTRRFRRLTLGIGLFTLLAAAIAVPIHIHAAAAPGRSNVVILMTDDQRWDKVTPRYMPNVYDAFVRHGYPFSDSFVPDPLCCPSRTSTLTGDFSHTTGVWNNGESDPRYGGFFAFDDTYTMATDFQAAGYRTGLIGKYLNQYIAGENRYVPPGWDRWFAVNGASYYDYGVTTNNRLLHYGDRAGDYITRVLEDQAETFVTNAVQNQQPFFLYYAFTAPHTPSIPDPRDVSRFAGETGTTLYDNMLASAYGADRAIGRLLPLLPPNTIVVYMSDNGFLWKEHKAGRGPLEGKGWPYNESIRVPIYFKSMDGSITPVANRDDLVLNVDLRASLEHAAGVSPATPSEGIDWFSSSYAARSSFPLERYADGSSDKRSPTYCGERELGWMYVRFLDSGNYVEELYNDESERVNLATDPAYAAELARLRTKAESDCSPSPPGYAWGS